MIIKHSDEKIINDQVPGKNGVAQYMSTKFVGGTGSVAVSYSDPSIQDTLDEWFNLVVIGGREYSLGKLSGQITNGKDYSQYKLAYFGVGSGGADLIDSSVKYGPYDTDVDLINREILVTTGINDPTNSYKYLDGGKLKIINDVDITIINQQIVPTTGDVTTEILTDTFTKCLYILRIEQDEMISPIFRFNEAGLYIVQYINGVPIDGTHELFARFTTSTKDKENTDTIQIEWSILT